MKLSLVKILLCEQLFDYGGARTDAHLGISSSSTENDRILKLGLI